MRWLFHHELVGKGRVNSNKEVMVKTRQISTIHLLQRRLDKDKLNIDGIVMQAEKLLKKYIT